MRCKSNMHGTLIFRGSCGSPAQVAGFVDYAQSFPQALEPHKHRVSASGRSSSNGGERGQQAVAQGCGDARFYQNAAGFETRGEHRPHPMEQGEARTVRGRQHELLFHEGILAQHGVDLAPQNRQTFASARRHPNIAALASRGRGGGGIGGGAAREFASLQQIDFVPDVDAGLGGDLERLEQGSDRGILAFMIRVGSIGNVQ